MLLFLLFVADIAVTLAFKPHTYLSAGLKSKSILKNAIIRASSPALDFLECTSAMPVNLFRAKEPFVATIVSIDNISGSVGEGSIYDVVLDHGGKMPFLEGQSYGVIPPGVNPKNGKSYINRLYTIASTRYGDNMQVL